MSGGAMVSWAIAVVSEFDSAGRRIPESVVPLLPMVDVVLWAKEQPPHTTSNVAAAVFHHQDPNRFSAHGFSSSTS